MSTTREEWLALAERIEKATESNREIDARISVAVGAVVMRFLKVSGKWAFWRTPVEPKQCASLSNVSGNEDDAFRALSEYTIAPHYTSSIDTITALIEREYAETPALALCAVFCRAMAERVLDDSPLKGET